MPGIVPLETGDPRQAGPFRIVGRLGAGGMGRVYLARSPGGRTVAVKVVREELADEPGFRLRFANEAFAARRVTGFFTAGVVDAGPDDDPPWLATAYVPGVSLTEAVSAHGAWPEPSVRALGAALAEALEAIHTADLVHRDLKPSNVLLAADGPRVIDFGIAVAAGATRFTGTGSVVGTPGYLPPEQLTGSETGPAGDVFALGAVLAYAAQGFGPFAGGSPHGVNYRVVNEEPDLTGVPDELAPIVSRCLAKGPERRPSVAELPGELGRFTGTGWLPASVADDITHVQGTTPPENAAGPVPPTSVATMALGPDRPSRSLSRRHALAGLGAAGVLAVLVPQFLRGDEASETPKPKKAAAPARKLAMEQLWSYEKDPVYPPKFADGTLYFGDRDDVLHAIDSESGERVWTYDGLKGLSQFTLAGGAIYADSVFESKQLHCVDADSGKKRWAFEPDEKRAGAVFMMYSPVAVAGGSVYVVAQHKEVDGFLYALDAENGRERWSRTVDFGLTKALTVADGVVYFGRAAEDHDQYLYALDARTGERLWRIKTGESGPYGDGMVSTIGVSGTTVCYGTDLSRFHAADTERGTVRWTFQAEKDDVLYPDWTAPLVVDGVVYTATLNDGGGDGEPGHVYALDAGSGKRLWDRATSGPPSAPVLAGDAVYVTESGTLYALDRRTGKPLDKVPLADDMDPRLTVSGDRIYFDAGDGRLHAGRITLR